MQPTTVVITGASSGIGKACAMLLAREGVRVFATVRRHDDGEALRREAGAALIPLILDVTDRSTIASAAQEVDEQLGGEGLDGLANVAGIGTSGPIEYLTDAELRRVFDVNVFGQIAVTQAFLPMLHRGRGRIVNMSSVGAHIAIPFGGALTASKSAFGSLSDSLRLELRPFGILVCAVEPGSINTPAVDKTLGDVEGVIARMPPDGARRYGDMLRAFASRAYAREKRGSSPEVVAEAVRHALTARRPHTRYVVGKDARTLAILPKLLPDGVLDALKVRLLGLRTTAAQDR